MLRFTKHGLIVLTSLVAGSIFAILPSRAATIALSEGQLSFTNFSQSPVSTFTDAQTQAISIFGGGSVFTEADAIAFFNVFPPFALNTTSTLATGSSQNYLGIAESFAQVVGNFNIEADTIFSFDFVANLSLFVGIERPITENANARADIFFALLDITNEKANVLETFVLAGNLSTQNNNSILTSFNDNSSLEILEPITQQRLLTATASGSVERYFGNSTTLSLIGINRNRAAVAVPEPSNYLTSLFIFGFILLALKRKQAKHTAKFILEKQHKLTQSNSLFISSGKPVSETKRSRATHT